MVDLLLHTKLYPPPAQGGLVPRPHLTDQLSRGLARKLTLISAPAGFGKSTLVAHWRETQPRPLAWVSLDEGDNDPVRFWTYVLAALRRLPAKVGEEALALLRSSPPPPLEAVLTALLNELSGLTEGVVLVLDDYHAIHAQAVHEGLSYLLENLPPQVHLIITTRVDPPLPLARLRARGQLSEFRAADLRFSDDEVARFFAIRMGIQLPPDLVTLLNARTDGWVAGLQLAGLSLKGHGDIASFVTALAGSHRYIADYLMEEVLQRLEPPLLDFLVRTSVLDRLTASLCEAVAGQPDAQALLHHLERANLFLIPLDEHRHWYRYHHLFQDLLQIRLRQEGPEVERELHRRASRWYEANGMIAEAVRHALAAQDRERAADLVDRCADALIREQGEYSTLIGWVRALPDDLIRQRPQLSMIYAAVLHILGDVEEGAKRWADAERAVSQMNPGEAELLTRRLTGLRAMIAWFQWDLPRAAHLVEEGLRTLDDSNLKDRGLLLYVAAVLRMVTAEVTDATAALKACIEANRKAGNLHVVQYSLCYLATSYMLGGKLRQASAVIEQALALVGGSALGDFPLAVRADLHRERNELDRADQDLALALELAARSGRPDPLRAAYTSLSRLRMAQGDRQGALAAAEKALQVPRQRALKLEHMLPSLRARVLLHFGEVAEAVRWAEEYEQSIAVPPPYDTEMADLVLARVYLATGRAGRALSFLGELERRAVAAGRLGSLIEILALQALAHDALGDGAGAADRLGRALALAEPEGYVRTFVDEGQPLARVLSRINTPYARHLLALMGGAPGEAPAEPRGRMGAALIEPLSEREVEVLRLVARGCSNQEIARRLFLAEGTVKKHTHNIFAKLGVSNRTQALVRAEALGLLDGRP